MHRRKLTKVLILLLALIAAAVFMGQCLHMNTWLLIVAYWGVLTVKNFVDYVNCKGN